MSIKIGNKTIAGVPDLSGKQDTLVSGTNIKTLNNESILGSGNIEVKSAPDLDNVTINKNSNDELQAIALIDEGNNEAYKERFVTEEEYNSMKEAGTLDPHTYYNTEGKGGSGGGETVSGATRPLFEHTILDYVSDEEGYGMADFFEWHNKSAYGKAYNKLLQEYTTGTEQEYREYKGINATKMGNPTISSDYIVSGFSTSNYLRVANVNLGNNFEIQVKVRTGDSMSTTNFAFTGNSIQSIVICQVSANISNFKYNIGNGSSFIVSNTSGTHTITTNTDYWVRMTFNGSVYKAYISTNGKDWEEDWSFNSTNIIPTFTLNIGVGRAVSDAFLGSVDLKECYIKINNTMWWEGCIYEKIIEYKLANNGHFIADATQEQNVINIYNSKNKAWYYILDQQNERFKLPRSKELLDDINSKTGTTNHLYFYLGGQ